MWCEQTYTLVDFITLRYLYCKCVEWREAWNGSAACPLAAGTESPAAAAAAAAVKPSAPEAEATAESDATAAAIAAASIDAVDEPVKSTAASA